jgi:hypothetical protein
MLVKKSKKVPKNAVFHADLKSVEKVFKKGTEKSYLQKCDEKMTLSTFTHVLQTCFAYNFFW